MSIRPHPTCGRRWVAALAATTLALSIVASTSSTASASVDFSGTWPPGWSIVTIHSYYKSYIYYGGTGSFLICAHATNVNGGYEVEDCGHAGDPVPEARLLHCGGHYAEWFLWNGASISHHMTDRFYTNPC